MVPRWHASTLVVLGVWSCSARVSFRFVTGVDHPSVRCRVAFYGPMDLRTDTTRTADDAPATDLTEYSPITHSGDAHDRTRSGSGPVKGSVHRRSCSK